MVSPYYHIKPTKFKYSIHSLTPLKPYVPYLSHFAALQSEGTMDTWSYMSDTFTDLGFVYSSLGSMEALEWERSGIELQLLNF